MHSRAGVLALLAIAGVALVSASVNTLWPQPSSFTSGLNNLGVSTSLSFVMSSGSGCQSSGSAAGQFLAPAFARYQTYIFWYNPSAANADGRVQQAFADVDALRAGAGVDAAEVEATGNITQVTVCVQSASLNLALGTDESYQLSVAASGAVSLTATNVYGALRGLETFSQLAEYDDVHDAYSVENAPVTINDAPRFQWRGFMIDTARHYLSPATIYRTIDAMSFNKLNVLHWHLVDAQSFPYASTAYPQLSQAGAYHPSAVYTPAFITQVVQYAAARGIRVVPELDGPGHAAAWGFDLAITTNCPKWSANINNINLTPVNNLTLQVLSAVYAEIAGLFPDNYFHIGGDEVVTDCWEDDPKVVAWMQANGLDSTGLYQYFLNQMTSLVKANGKKSDELGRPLRQWSDH